MSFVANKIVQYTDSLGNPTDVTEANPLPVTEKVEKGEEVLFSILKELRLLNLRFEEAFQTQITEGDIQDEN